MPALYQLRHPFDVMRTAWKLLRLIAGQV